MMIRSTRAAMQFRRTGDTFRLRSSVGGSAKPDAELAQLRREVKELHRLVAETQTQQAAHVERLVQRVESQVRDAEKRLGALYHHDSPFDQVRNAAKDFVQHNEALAKLTEQISRQANRYPRVVNRYTVAALFASLLILWRYWASIQTRTSEEVAEIASKTLEQEQLRQSIQETLDALAGSSETQESVTRLLQALVQEPSTQEHLVHLLVYAVGTDEVQGALKGLLESVFQDPNMQELSGQFLLKGLDVDTVRIMLDEQTQSLVKRTVSDAAVQKATGAGVRKSLWHAFVPFW